MVYLLTRKSTVARSSGSGISRIKLNAQRFHEAGDVSGSPIGTDTGPACLSKDEDPDPDTAPRDPDFVRILHDMAPRESGS